MFFVVCAHVHHPAEGVQWINESLLYAGRSIDNADVDKQRDPRRVVGILPQTDSSAE
jgi:hypothetical protein